MIDSPEGALVLGCAPPPIKGPAGGAGGCTGSPDGPNNLPEGRAVDADVTEVAGVSTHGLFQSYVIR